MKNRIAIWASTGFLVAVGWALYFAISNKDLPIEPVVYAITRLTCPIAIAGAHFPISMYWVFLANAATYAIAGMIVEAVRLELHPAK